ncbi:uncharacterized protein LOC120895365 [Anopheles arabiensis]|uniref:Uncharacterized protein n=1 Tax=Anopheles arabiensis TaxID=7173 RepID=A0A182HS09_ANOAR|nr:uncharacterized protein LOC120895365 [Anopheles arabiensis]
MDEDLEFRDMVWKKMEENGSLLEIKANLRAILDDMLGDENSVAADQTEGSGPSSSTVENDSENPPDGQTLAFELMLEMMDVLEFPYTKKALQSESRHRRMALSREQLAKHIGLKSDEVRRAPSEQPLLVTLIEKVREERERNSADVASIPDDPEP